MKKIFVFLIATGAFLGFHTMVKAEWVPPIQLEFFQIYADSIPVVANNFNGYFLEVIGEKQSVSKLLPAGAKVLEINGISAVGKSKDKLNELMRQADTLRLTVAYSVHGDTCTAYNLTFAQKNNLNGYGDLMDIQQGYLYNINKEMPDNGRPSSIRVIGDYGLLLGELNFSKIKTYDIMITGNDPLTDKKILGQFCSSGFFRELRRDEENPDIIVCVAKNSQESISSTYVPPTSETINTGSVTRPVYNYITKTYSFVTTQRNRTVTTDGYTQSTTNTSIFLEFTILDAKRLNDPDQKTAPIIWQMTYTRNVINRAFEVLDEYLAIAGWNCYPFTVSPYIEVPLWFIGAQFFKTTDGVQIDSDVVPESSAAKLGVQKGDIILKLNNKKHYISEREYYDYYAMKYKYEKNKTEIRHMDYLGKNIAFLLAMKESYSRAKDYSILDFEASRWLYDLYGTYLIERNGSMIKLNGSLIESPGINFSYSRPRINKGWYGIWRLQ